MGTSIGSAQPLPSPWKQMWFLGRNTTSQNALWDMGEEAEENNQIPEPVDRFESFRCQFIQT